MRISIGSDHAGYDLKQHLIGFLEAAGHEVRDHGTDSTESVDYPPFCADVARAVVAGDADVGIVMGGSGQGEQIAANKVDGIRAALVGTAEAAALSTQHNNANMICLAGNDYQPEQYREIVSAWLEAEFEGGRHQRRLDKVAGLE